MRVENATSNLHSKNPMRLFSLDSFRGGDVGLALSQALGACGMLPHGLTRSIEMSAYMASVNRVLQYTKLPAEGDWESKKPPPPEWPQHGHLCLNNVSLQYEKGEPPVLKVFTKNTRLYFILGTNCPGT